MANKRSRQQAEGDGNITTTTVTHNGTAAHFQSNSHDQAMSDAKNARPSEDDGWQEASSQGKKKRRKNPAKGTSNYPSIYHSPNARLQSTVKISDLQNLILYVLSDGAAPQWVAIRHHNAIKRVVALTIPGFDPGLFTANTPLLDIVHQDVESKASQGALNEVETTDNDTSVTDAPTTKQDCKSESTSKKMHLSPDDYYPKKLNHSALPSILRPFADIFEHIWPLKAPGDDKFAKIHSPLQSMLLSQIPKAKEDKKKKGPALAKSNGFADKPTPVTEFLASLEELESNEYVLHPAIFETELARTAAMKLRTAALQSAEHGWVDTEVDGQEPSEPEQTDIQQEGVTVSRKVIAIDCEMCKTDVDRFELTRISVLDWDGNVILDELVKPHAPITDYLTPYSGITEEMLKPVTTRLENIQERLQEIITPSTIIIGHSLDGDFKALQMTHPFIVDTAMIYPHPRGPPLKSSLKWLSQKYLGREIQQSHGTTGHDSIEDARAVLDLVKQKCEKGPKWGTSEASSESIFNRLKRSQIPKLFRTDPEAEEFRTGAAIDWGNPSRGLGANADVIVCCESDADVAKGVKSLLNPDGDAQNPNVDFIWARFREVEAIRGWWEKSKTSDNNEMRQKTLSKYSLTEDDVKNPEPNQEALSTAVAQTVQYISEIYNALPPCTAFIVYSGHGDPREVFRMQALHQQFRHEYRTKKWDQLSVKWTDVEEQQLRKASKKAREAVGFITVK
jgi:RNA exonuclease 1